MECQSPSRYLVPRVTRGERDRFACKPKPNQIPSAQSDGMNETSMWASQPPFVLDSTIVSYIIRTTMKESGYKYEDAPYRTNKRIEHRPV